MSTLKSNQFFFIILLLLVSVAFFGLIQPYYSAIIWAIILALIFYPLRMQLSVWLRGRNGIASLITVLLICVIVFIPMMMVLSSLAVEINSLYQRLQNNATDLPQLLSNGIAHLPDWAKGYLRDNDFDSVNAIREKLSGVALSVGRYLAGSAVIIGKGTLGITVSFCLMVYLLFFLLKDGATLVRQIYEVMPLTATIKRRLFLKFAGVARATVKGTLVVAIVQGALGGIGFWFAGFNGSLLWAALMAFLSLIPAVGTAIVWIPAVIFLYSTDEFVTATVLTLYFVIVVGLADNLLRPLLVGKDTRMPDYLILLTTLGGLQFFGINGFVLGPMIAALFITSWNLLAEARASVAKNSPPTPPQ
ncbi:MULTISPECIES: AI-2E family transporter [Kosakonia]|uniref:AI-2E family transporter n=1 Tax=Kosakonia TaxID=1330547 RepID=UPI000568987B|nr:MULTISPECIES: AI-2E family transporter [Kosakonia]NCF07786.1 AI-2E family transporter [Kosakonia sp. MH5]SES94500.1 Predicted PurR-regulated permease PerM [Kosakonia radicincitans]SKC22183.1 Predicted PurR-regulated permease PerM [Kosakonia radicincitans]